MLEALKEVVFFMKTGSQKGKHFPAEIRQNFPLPDRNRNRKMEPDIRPEPDFAGYPVGSYWVPNTHYQKFRYQTLSVNPLGYSLPSP